jgi:hypothetical protein
MRVIVRRYYALISARSRSKIVFFHMRSHCTVLGLSGPFFCKDVYVDQTLSLVVELLSTI